MDEELSEFLEDMYYEDAPSVDYEATTALLYTEAFLNWKYSHDDKNVSISKTFELTVQLDLTAVGPQWFADGADLLVLNQLISDSLELIGNDSIIEGSPSEVKFWSNIDVEIPDSASYSSTITIKVKAKLGNQKSSICDFQNDWKGYVTGLCNSSGTEYVVDRIEAYLNNIICIDGHLENCPGKYRPLNAHYYYYYVKYNFLSSSTNGAAFGQTNIWKNVLHTSCVTSTFLNTLEIPEMINFAVDVNNKPFPYSKINSYEVDRDYQSNYFTHKVTVNYFHQCLRVKVNLVAPEDTEHALLKPTFNNL